MTSRTHISPRSPHLLDPTARRGFTLVELLVVIAVVALLIGVLLPALAGARASGWQIKDASLQKQLMLGMSAWSNENDLQIPGINTSGVRYRQLQGGAADDLAKLNKASKPVQSFDWISVSLDDAQLPENRSERFGFILNEYANPANKVILGSQSIDFADSGDFQDYIDGTGTLYSANGAKTVAAPSYFMAASWQWAGPATSGSASNILDKRYEQPAGEQDVVELSSSWFPRVTNVGASSDKAAISNAVVDIDDPTLPAFIWRDPQEEVYGAFCHSTPCRADSKNFATDLGSEKIDASYTHGGKLNAGYWDGHVSSLTPQESQDPGLWYPRGSIMGSAGATDLARDLYSPGDKIN